MLRSYIYIALPVLGLFLIVFVSISIYNFFKIKKWKKYNIKILNKKLLYKNTISTLRAETFKPFVQYKYKVNGIEYISSKIAFDDECIMEEIPLNFPYERDNNPPPYELLDKILIIQTAFINPSNPKESLLIHVISQNRKNYYFLMFVCGILLIASSFLI